MKNFYVAILKAESNYYVLLNDKLIVIGFNTLKKGLNYFEETYKEAHTRSYERSISAALNYITFSPRLILFKDVEELKQYVQNPAKPLQMSHVAGYYNVVKMDKKKIKKLYDSGVAPDLI